MWFGLPRLCVKRPLLSMFAIAAAQWTASTQLVVSGLIACFLPWLVLQVLFCFLASCPCSICACPVLPVQWLWRFDLAAWTAHEGLFFSLFLMPFDSLFIVWIMFMIFIVSLDRKASSHRPCFRKEHTGLARFVKSLLSNRHNFA